jgi:arginine exporter protein ArgO
VDTFLAGAVAGYGIAIPVGAIATYLVALTARTTLRVGAAAALGVATADGVYALVAVLGGAALAGLVAAVSEPLHWAAAAVLLALAARVVVTGVAEYRSPHAASGPRLVGSPGRAFTVLLGATMLNPTTVVYFTALVLGSRAALVASAADRVWFVTGAFLASASWQLLLVGGGAAVGHALTGRRGRLATAVVSGSVIAALAVRTVLG